MLLEWYVFYTFPKAEKVIKQELEKSNFQVCLPLQKVTRQWKDRKKVLEMPLFPNYIFVKTIKSNVYHIVNHPKIVKYLAFEGKPAKLKDEEIEFINSVCKFESEICITPFRKGDRIRINGGVLNGYEGILTEVKGKKTFGFHLKEVNQMLWVDISKVRIEKIDLTYL
jgi:transcription antitermination factor NusG